MFFIINFISFFIPFVCFANCVCYYETTNLTVVASFYCESSHSIGRQVSENWSGFNHPDLINRNLNGVDFFSTNFTMFATSYALFCFFIYIFFL